MDVMGLLVLYLTIRSCHNIILNLKRKIFIHFNQHIICPCFEDL